MQLKKYITRKEVCSYLAEQGINVSVSQLTKYATNGGGPVYFKFGKKKVLYKPEDIDIWVKENLSAPLTNTSCYIKTKLEGYKYDYK